MCDTAKESLKLVEEIRGNEASYISGELHLSSVLDKTERLYRQTVEDRNLKVSNILKDCDLIDLETDITRKCAISCTPGVRKFDPREFSAEVRSKFLTGFFAGEQPEDSGESIHKVWEQLGEYSQRVMLTVPDFSFIYGTFDESPIEEKTKERQTRPRDKIGALTHPEEVKSAKNEGDETIAHAMRIQKLFEEYIKKSKKKAVCFYEFVLDPTSFGRTIENIFYVSILIKERCICMFEDDDELPFLKPIKENVDFKKSTPSDSTIISLSKADWEDIVKTLKSKRPLIPPRLKEMRSDPTH